MSENQNYIGCDSQILMSIPMKYIVNEEIANWFNKEIFIGDLSCYEFYEKKFDDQVWNLKDNVSKRKGITKKNQNSGFYLKFDEGWQSANGTYEDSIQVINVWIETDNEYLNENFQESVKTLNEIKRVMDEVNHKILNGPLRGQIHANNLGLI